MRSCPRYGPGFFEIPGTTTCIRIGGRVRSDVTLSGKGADKGSARGTAAGMRSSGMISTDTRTDTAYGPLRTYVRVRAGQETGPWGSSSRP